jgi:acyl CoA:acetate/3-ketoacid CoA transferase alpha subunit
VPKIFSSASECLDGILDDATIMVGGFGLCGIPQGLINALHEKNVTGLTIISNNCGTTDLGLGILLKSHRIKKMISSYVGENKEFETQFLTGGLEVELVPQGTLAEKIRAGGAGIPAFFTATGAGTLVALGGLPLQHGPSGEVIKTSTAKEARMFGEKEYILEESLTADFALIKAFKADMAGNLVFRKTARNFNPMMCCAAKVTIVEAEHIVPVGEIDPDQVHIPGAYVDRLVQGGHEKWIEQLTTRGAHA